MTPEAKVKAYFKKCCKEWGFIAVPLRPATGFKGWPDYTVLIDNTGKTAFVEVKEAKANMNKKHVKEQSEMLQTLRGKGHFAEFAIGKEGVDACVKKMLAL